MGYNFLTTSLLCLAAFSLSSGARVRLQIEQPSFRNARSGPCSDLEAVDKSNLTALVAGVPLPWSKESTKVWRSTCMTATANKLLDNEVGCIYPKTTFRQIFTLFAGENCWLLMWGGAVRDMILGDVPRDMDAESSCELPQLIEVCNKYYPGQCWLSRNTSYVLHIGGSLDTETNMDVANWNATVFGEGTALEYTTNSMGYDWLQHITVDVATTGADDTSKTLVRIPVPEAQWETWANTGGDKTIRFWKLLLKKYKPADDATFEFSKNRLRYLTTTDSGKVQLKVDYCKYALGGKTIAPGVCAGEADCNKTNAYDTILQEDLGMEFWNSTLRPLFKDDIKCEYSARKPCATPTPATAPTATPTPATAPTATNTPATAPTVTPTPATAPTATNTTQSSVAALTLPSLLHHFTLLFSAIFIAAFWKQ